MLPSSKTDPITSNLHPRPKSKPNPKPERSLLQNDRVFDPWNSTSTGHQRAENPFASSVAWREARAMKLERQFRGETPEKTTQDSDSDDMCIFGVGGYDTEQQQQQQQKEKKSRPTSDGGEWRWVPEIEARRNRLGVRDIRCYMGVGKKKAAECDRQNQEKKEKKRIGDQNGDGDGGLVQVSTGSYPALALTSSPGTSASTTSTSNILKPTATPSSNINADTTTTKATTAADTTQSTVLAGTTIHINGSTLPQISDHKLKHLLVAHGARISIAMARKSVTHVIVGQPNSQHPSSLTSATTGSTPSSTSSSTSTLTFASTSTSTMQNTFQGAGGGLAARKLQQEIARGGWKGVKVVGVEWALESIKAGRRLAESRFAVLHVASKRQRSVRGMFGRGTN